MSGSMRQSLFARAVGEDGQALAYEVIAIALIIFAIFGALSLFGRLT